jgi:hypothetical protein
VWAVAAASLPALAALRAVTAPSPVIFAIAVAAAVSIAVIAGRDLIALARLPRPDGLRQRNPQRLANVSENGVLDLGMGAVEWEETAPPNDPYRSSERVLRIIRGDFLESRRALARLVAFDAALLCFAIGWLAIWQTVR